MHLWPCDLTEKGRFRKTLNKKEVKELLSRSVEVAVTLKLIAKRKLTRMTVDSKVQEKAETHPTDSKLLETAMSKLITEEAVDPLSKFT